MEKSIPILTSRQAYIPYPQAKLSNFEPANKLTRIQWTFLVFFAIFEVGSALCGAAASSDMLIVGRVVAGLGASGLLNGGLTIIHFIVPASKRNGKCALQLQTKSIS